MILSFILGFFVKNSLKNLFFVGLGLNELGFTLNTVKWSKEGITGFKNIAKNYNKNLTRRSSDTMLFMNISYYFILCICILTETIEKTNFNSNFSLMPILGISIVINYALLFIIDKTYNEVVEIIKNKKQKGNVQN